MPACPPTCEESGAMGGYEMGSNVRRRCRYRVHCHRRWESDKREVVAVDKWWTAGFTVDECPQFLLALHVTRPGPCPPSSSTRRDLQADLLCCPSADCVVNYRVAQPTVRGGSYSVRSIHNPVLPLD
ncbi:hypothetical protein PISMIDRAFT_235612 [Pisolithus microcarpus 441]|uniref:Uncharacterized protein n=1 Tax=Pisolithus microcarpus 441 TaxID=765257 RepID=A0A0C9XX88_9AGAM|nr:hypothetical protein PISMIDRAFT_235612 [Pisolithus microcarpus 441]